MSKERKRTLIQFVIFALVIAASAALIISYMPKERVWAYEFDCTERYSRYGTLDIKKIDENDDLLTGAEVKITYHRVDENGNPFDDTTGNPGGGGRYPVPVLR